LGVSPAQHVSFGAEANLVMSPISATNTAARVGLCSRAEAAEPVGRQDLGLVGELGGQLVRRGVLVVDQGVGVVRPEQIGASGGAEEQRPAGEDPDVVPLGLQGVRQVRVGMARRGNDLYPQGVTDVD